VQGRGQFGALSDMRKLVLKFHIVAISGVPMERSLEKSNSCKNPVLEFRVAFNDSQFLRLCG